MASSPTLPEPAHFTNAPRYIHRFSRTERLLHWVHAAAFFVLLGSGLVLYLPSLSEIVYVGGKFYLAAVRDVFSNRIVGWSTSTVNDTDLILRALEYAAWHRDYTQSDLIHHSD